MTKAIILAAGQGTRLRPITDDRPKCLVPLMGKTLLERQITTLNALDIFDINIATGYRSDQIERLGFPTSYNTRFASTNMVESLFCAINFLKECKDDLVIAYGDIIYQKENLKKVLMSNEEVTLMIDLNWRDLWAERIENPLEDAETLVINKQGFVEEIGKKPINYEKIHGQYTGLIKIRSDKVSDLIDFYLGLKRDSLYDGKDFENMYMTSFLQLLINKKWKVKAAEVHGGWLEVDSVKDLRTYESLYSQNQLQRFIDI